MLKLVVAAILAGALPVAIGGGAAAGTGRCCAAGERRAGPAVEAARSDPDRLGTVCARGGTRNGIAAEAEAAPRRFTPHEAPNHRHLLRHAPMPHAE